MKLSIKPILNIFYSVVAATCLFGLLLVACQDTPDNVDRIQSMNDVQLSEGQIQEDAAFLASFHYDLMFSDKMAKVAAKYSKDTAVTSIANMILEDHQEIRNKLFAVVDQHGILLPYRLSEEAYEEIEALKEEDELSRNRKYLSFVVDHHAEARKGVDEIIAETNKVATIMDLARLISAQSKVHENMAARYLEKLNQLSDESYSFGDYSQYR